jgi:hypothetical protein
VALTSLSQDCRSTGTYGRLDAWRAWIGPPQGASTGWVRRLLPNPVRDRRNLLQSPTFAVQALRPSRPASWRVAFVGRGVPERRSRRGIHLKMEWQMLKRLHQAKVLHAVSSSSRVAHSLRLELEWFRVLLWRQKQLRPPSRT